MNGLGRKFFAFGDEIEGNFLNGITHGKCKYIFKDKKVYFEGYWQNDVLAGNVTYFKLKNN